MKLKFLGGAHEVGRMAISLESEWGNFLVDYGVMFDLEDIFYPMLPDLNTLDAVILTHAHLDHSAMLPALYQWGYNDQTVMTTPTKDICKVMHNDYLKVAKQERKICYFNKEDIKRASDNTFSVGYREEIALRPNCHLEFLDAGHVPGAAMAKMGIGKKSLMYTGDFKLEETQLHRGADFKGIQVDTLITESTYACNEHPARKSEEKRFVDIIKATTENRGVVVVPVFALGRAQEVLLILEKYGVKCNRYLDGMGRDISKIVAKYPEYLKDRKLFKKAHEHTTWITKSSQRKEAVEDERAVIVTTSGMMQGGPVGYYMEMMRGDPRSAVVLTGYQIQGLPGKTLVKEKKWMVQGEMMGVKAKVHALDLSAHAGHTELLETVKSLGKKGLERVFCVHGEATSCDALAEEIRQKFGVEAYSPKLGETHEF